MAWYNTDKEFIREWMVCFQRIVNDYFKISNYKIINEINNCEKML